jgi:hypothetical protein
MFAFSVYFCASYDAGSKPAGENRENEMRKLLFAVIAGSASLAAPAAVAQRQVPGADYALTPAPDRISVFVSRNQRGTSVPIDHAALTRLCGDEDGCSVRIGMHNWDDTGRVASRETLFFYNRRNGNWRSALGDASGTDSNNTTEHPIHAWACYMTDGVYRDFTNQNDPAAGFALMSWREFNTDCWLTIID